MNSGAQRLDSHAQEFQLIKEIAEALREKYVYLNIRTQLGPDSIVLADYNAELYKKDLRELYDKLAEIMGDANAANDALLAYLYWNDNEELALVFLKKLLSLNFDEVVQEN